MPSQEARTLRANLSPPSAAAHSRPPQAACFNRTAELQNSSVVALLSLAHVLRESGQPAAAREASDRAFALDNSTRGKEDDALRPPRSGRG